MSTYLYIAVPVVAVIIGGVIAAYRPPGPRLSSGIQHFAAGVVFAAVAAELLPEITALHSNWALVLGFSLGVAVMLAIRELAAPKGGEGSAANNTGLLVTVGIDLMVDGFLVGIGFSAGGKTGVLITVALTLEVLFLGLSVAATLGASGASRARIIRIMVGFAALLGASAAVGILLLSGLSGGPETLVLAFGAAALLYLVTEELLTEAHEVRETPVSTALFFVGFLLLFILDGLV